MNASNEEAKIEAKGDADEPLATRQIELPTKCFDAHNGESTVHGQKSGELRFGLARSAHNRYREQTNPHQPM